MEAAVEGHHGVRLAVPFAGLLAQVHLVLSVVIEVPYPPGFRFFLRHNVKKRILVEKSHIGPFGLQRTFAIRKAYIAATMAIPLHARSLGTYGMHNLRHHAQDAPTDR